MKNILLISSFCMLCIGFSSCSNENDEFVQDNKEMNTRSVKAIHTFPNVSRIKTDPDVVKKMNEAWEEMKNYAGKGKRREYGFYIYYDESSDKIHCGKMQMGDNIPNCEGTHASIELKPDYPALEFQNTVCAHFHCHTTLQYCPSYVSRETGPSIGDINFANSQQLPGILYDYEDAKIYGGDSKDKKYKMQTFGEYAQRPDRIY